MYLYQSIIKTGKRGGGGLDQQRENLNFYVGSVSGEVETKRIMIIIVMIIIITIIT